MLTIVVLVDVDHCGVGRCDHCGVDVDHCGVNVDHCGVGRC